MKIFIFIILGISLFSCGSKPNDADIKQMINDGALVVDVRTPNEFAQGAVDGAINIPLQSIEARISEFEGKSGVVVYCRSGKRSGQAMVKLEKKGITNVVNGKNMATINKAIAQ